MAAYVGVLRIGRQATHGVSSLSLHTFNNYQRNYAAWCQRVIDELEQRLHLSQDVN
ncbi:MAG TPA: hypothetical protein VKP04_04405 [Ktedonobacteraceae bacterium]|nr:hypothetical protein [Ktedonobacteraceae bacterium]